MKSQKRLALYVAVLAVLVLTAFPSFASKRRAVSHPSASLSTQISGVVLDATTSAPVNAAEVRIGDRTFYTDAQGRFITTVIGHGMIEITAERSGYHPTTTTVAAGGSHQLTMRLTPRPTVSVRKTDGSQLQIDYETVMFGYPVPFSGYRSAEYEDFCLPNGSAVPIDRSEMKRIVGPATPVTQSACCTTGPVLRVNLQLRNGQTTDVFFADSCDASDKIDLIGRNHVTGLFVYLRFTDITEVVFP
jgi:hypothetical protein